MDLQDYLKLMVKYDASDLFFTTGAPVIAKVQGMMRPIEKTTLPAGRVRELANMLMSADQIAQYDKKPEMNLAHSEPGVGRFRVNIFQQRNQTAMVIRNIKTVIPTPESLGLPQVLKKIIMQKRGLILFVGGTGSGKSTSLASLIDYRNTNSSGHIITIEDPIEFIHNHKKSIVNQREVGMDTDCYEDALKNTLRQAPDVILSHLAISTLHANNANQALDRIINFFPDERRNQLLMDLSLNVRAFISQRLIPTVDGKRAMAV
jgi:twitching motility protein PilU